MTTFFFPSFLDLLKADAIGAVFLAWLAFSYWNRRREDRLTRESVADEVTARMFSAWNNDDSELHRLQDLSAITGEVLYFEEDELGRWFPGQHDEVPPLLYQELTKHPVEQWNETKPWWLSQTGSWPTVAPRQLEASPS